MTGVSDPGFPMMPPRQGVRRIWVAGVRQNPTLSPNAQQRLGPALLRSVFVLPVGSVAAQKKGAGNPARGWGTRGVSGAPEGLGRFGADHHRVASDIRHPFGRQVS